MARKLYSDYMNKVEYMRKYQEWSTSPIFDEETRKELLLIAGDEEEIKDHKKEYTGENEQDELIHEWCDNNDYRYDDSYELAVQNCFNYD